MQIVNNEFVSLGNLERLVCHSDEGRISNNLNDYNLFKKDSSLHFVSFRMTKGWKPK